MKTHHLLFVGVLAVVGMVIYYAFSGAQIDENYVQDMEAFRADKDKRFASSSESPLDKESKTTFEGLSYFSPNPAYRITADLEWEESPQTVTLPTTQDGKTQDYLIIAYASFKLGGESHRVQLLKAADRPTDQNMYLFFKDATSGQSTYGAGRYVDIKAKKSSTCTIDFNMAYNPYCAYNSYYICPLPPPENVLNIAIEAGEKQYYKKDKKEAPTDES